MPNTTGEEEQDGCDIDYNEHAISKREQAFFPLFGDVIGDKKAVAKRKRELDELFPK